MTWEERSNALQGRLQYLTQERTTLKAKLEMRNITEQQIQDIQKFAQRILESITLVDENYKLKRRLIEMLNVQVMLCVDPEGDRCAQVSCMLGDERLSIESISMSGSSFTTTAQKSTIRLTTCWLA